MTENYVMDELFEIADSGRIGHRTTNTDNAQPSEFASNSYVYTQSASNVNNSSVGRSASLSNEVKSVDFASSLRVYSITLYIQQIIQLDANFHVEVSETCQDLRPNRKYAAYPYIFIKAGLLDANRT